LSKGLTGGFLPMGVTLVSERLFQGFIGTDPALTLFHGHSFTANPLGCAAALASLDLLEQHPERHQMMEARHRPLLETLARDPRVRKPRLLGSIAAFDLVSPNVEGQEGYLHPIGRQLQRRVLAEGVFLRPLGQVVYLLPPLCISDVELERCYGALTSALECL
ncbi:MAG: aminotransferase class III-fold pyridoxal phosphate-dependent enzyme, partial [Cyanobium sp.]